MNKTHLRRRALITATAVTTVGMLAACSGGTENGSNGGPTTGDNGGAGETTSLNLSLDWSTYVAYHAPLVLAAENGIFEDHGLDVTMTLPGGSGDAVLEVGSGRTDIAWADLSTSAASMLQGLPVTAVAKVQDQNASGLTALKGTELESAEDVVGMRIGSTPGGSDSTLVGAFLSANGLTENDVQIVNLPANGKFPALLTGDVDLISGQVYFYVSGAEAEGQQAHGLSYSDLGLNVLDHGFVAADSFISEDPEAITRFLEAYHEALTATVEDPAAACTILAGESNGAVIQDQCEKQLELWLPLVTDVNDPEWGMNDLREWESTVETLTTHGDAEGDRDPESMFTNDLVPDVS